MIHGKLRDGDAYWTTMNTILQDSVKTNTQGADANAIVVAPQFFSARYNSGQYADNILAWGDVNAWQAGDPAVHPDGTKMTSFDALDALVDNFLDATTYPAMQRIIIVGHGGGGQLGQRYATVAKSPSNTNIRIRYIHGDPSSCAYFTDDRPSLVDGPDLPSKSSCPLYNTWRYGFDNFTGTGDGLKSPQDYFRQYVSRDVISIVGYQDVDASGDDYCMAQMQGGIKRRDRNLVWWQYINTLAKTGEDLDGFPGKFANLPDWSGATNGQFGVRLIVVENADHNAQQVFESDEGRAALFSNDNLPTGWRPSGWKNTTKASLPWLTTKKNLANNQTASNTPPQADESNAKSNAVALHSSLAFWTVALTLSVTLALHISFVF